MRISNAGKYIATIAGIFFSSLIVTQQLSILFGIISRRYAFIADTKNIAIASPLRGLVIEVTVGVREAAFFLGSMNENYRLALPYLSE